MVPSGGEDDTQNNSQRRTPFLLISVSATDFFYSYVLFQTGTKARFQIYLEGKSWRVASWNVAVSKTKLRLKNDWRT